MAKDPNRSCSANPHLRGPHAAKGATPMVEFNIPHLATLDLSLQLKGGFEPITMVVLPFMALLGAYSHCPTMQEWDNWVIKKFYYSTVIDANLFPDAWLNTLRYISYTCEHSKKIQHRVMVKLNSKNVPVPPVSAAISAHENTENKGNEDARGVRHYMPQMGCSMSFQYPHPTYPRKNRWVWIKTLSPSVFLLHCRSSKTLYKFEQQISPEQISQELHGADAVNAALSQPLLPPSSSDELRTLEARENRSGETRARRKGEGL